MKPEDLADLKARATRPRRTVPVVLDGELREQIERLEAGQPDSNDRRLTGTAPAGQRAEQLAALSEQADAVTMHVVVQGLPGTPYRALLAEHPPRRDAEGKVFPEDSFGANEETLRQPLVRACIIGHRPTPDAEVEPLDDGTVDWLLDFVTDRQMDQLVGASLGVCRGDAALPLRRTRSTIPASGDE